MTACEGYYNKFYFPLLSAKKLFMIECQLFVALIFCNMETFFAVLQILTSRPFVEGLLGEFLKIKCNYIERESYMVFACMDI